MKRWLSGLLAALLLFSLAGCGGVMDLMDLPEEAPVEDADAVFPAAEDPEDGEASISPAPDDPALSGGGETTPDPPEEAEPAPEPDSQEAEPASLPEDGTYTTKDDVALYIHTYGRLPDNFITKKEAQDLGWPGGSLEPYAPGMCIGGSRFGNYEGLLPEAEGRRYTECDIDTLGAKSRGAKRIVFSNDGLIYYTGDHYESFELLYGDESNG